MTVQELVEMLQKVGLENLSEIMKNKTWQLASVMDEVVCSSTNMVNPAKLRRDAEHGKKLHVWRISKLMHIMYAT